MPLADGTLGLERLPRQRQRHAFVGTRADPAEPLRTADRDLAPFGAHTFGLLLAIELELLASLDSLRVDLGYEHFVRSNQLTAEIYTWTFALQF